MIYYYILLYIIIYYYILLYIIIFYYILAYYTILYYVILWCYFMLYYGMLYHVVLCCIILYYIMLCYTISYYIIFYYIVLYYIILYYTYFFFFLNYIILTYIIYIFTHRIYYAHIVQNIFWYIYIYVCICICIYIYIYAEIALWKSLQTESPAWSLIYCWLSWLFKTIANQWIWRNADVIGSTVLSSLRENAQVIVPSSWWLCIPSHGQQLRLPTIYKSTSMVYKDLGYFGLSNNFSVLPNLRYGLPQVFWLPFELSPSFRNVKVACGAVTFFGPVPWLRPIDTVDKLVYN